MVKYYPKFLKCFGVALSLCFVTQGAFAKSGPLVVEYYGANSCITDLGIQEQLIDILHEYQDAILVNCRMYIGRENESPRYTNDFCNERAITYGHSFRVPGKLPLVVVNGRWDAINKNVLGAIKMGYATDKVEEISVQRDNAILKVSVPSVQLSKKGRVVLYTYRPSEGLHYEVKSATQVLEDRGVSLPQSAAPAISAEKDDLFIRSIISIDTVGVWNGEAQNMTFDLSDVIAGHDIAYDDIGYAVVLHDRQDYGAVLAAGQILPPGEHLRFLPHSEPGYQGSADETFKSLGQ